MYKGEADWSYIATVKNHPGIPIFDNGNIDSPQKALAYKNTYCIDGIMIGRAIIGYPWIFQEIKHFFATSQLLPPGVHERVAIVYKHLQHAVQWKGERTGIL